MRFTVVVAGGLAAACCAIAEDVPYLWGGRAEHPAVVNPAVADQAECVMSLRGEWEFVAQPMKAPWRNGVWHQFFRDKEWKGSRKINVPGCWEAQGVGEPGMGECWVPLWDNNAKPIRHKYMGDGWYRKTVTIPAGWKGKRIWLKVGGVKSCGWFWVNDRQVALVENYCGTYKYEITDIVTPGSDAKIVAQVNNVRPSRKGLMSAMHRWGGIYRDVELEATPREFIDDAWVRGDFDGKKAEVNVKVEGGDWAGSLVLRATVEGEKNEIELHPSSLQQAITLEVPLRNFRAWSPEHPNLYTGIVELVKDGSVIHSRRERFGVRKIEVRGKEFYLNGKPCYMRGFGDDHVYPITGMTPADRDVHRRHLAKARAAGFNFVRLHTHCEVPEYFEAADELGIMIEAELPYYSDVPAEDFEFDPKRDVTELWRHYRRHPSFMVYSMGNEGSYGAALDAQLHAYVKKMDPDRLKINQDSNVVAINPPEAADYVGGPIKEWPRGSVNPDRPFVTHEYLNLCIKLDSRSEGDYTGAWMPPMTRKARGEWLAKASLGMEWGDRLQTAQHALQRHYQKQGVESARKDPYCDGHCFWTIVDVVVSQGASYTAQGLFDPFWRQKRGGFSAEEFAMFNSPSCVLLDAPDDRRVYTSGETLMADFLFAHYGDAALKDAVLEWRLDSRDDASAAADRIVIGSQPMGAVRKVASAKIVFPAVAKPIKMTLAASVRPRRSTPQMKCASNAWDFWVFPARARKDGKGIAVVPSLKEAMDRLYSGCAVVGTDEAKDASLLVADSEEAVRKFGVHKNLRAVVVGAAEGVPNVKLGWWWMGDQVGTALLKHPVFGDLPHEGVLSPLIFRIVGKGKPLGGAGMDERDLFMVGEGGSDCFAYLARCRIDGVPAVESFGLDLLSGKPEGTAILDGMIRYAKDN